MSDKPSDEDLNQEINRWLGEIRSREGNVEVEVYAFKHFMVLPPHSRDYRVARMAGRDDMLLSPHIPSEELMKVRVEEVALPILRLKDLDGTIHNVVFDDNSGLMVRVAEATYRERESLRWQLRRWAEKAMMFEVKYNLRKEEVHRIETMTFWKRLLFLFSGKKASI